MSLSGERRRVGGRQADALRAEEQLVQHQGGVQRLKDDLHDNGLDEQDS